MITNKNISLIDDKKPEYHIQSAKIKNHLGFLYDSLDSCDIAINLNPSNKNHKEIQGLNFKKHQSQKKQT